MTKQEVAKKVFSMEYEDYERFMESGLDINEWPSIEDDIRLMCENEGYTLQEITEEINKSTFTECQKETLVELDQEETDPADWWK